MLVCCVSIGHAQAYYGEEAIKMKIREDCQDFTIHVKSKSTQDSIPDMSFQLLHLLNPIYQEYDTVTINTVAREKIFTLLGDVKRTKNDIFFKNLSGGDYTLYLYIGKKKHVKKFFLYRKNRVSEITIDVD